MPLTDEQKEALAPILADAEPGDLPGYVPQATLTSRLKDKDIKRQNLAADHDAAMASLQAERDTDAAELKAFRDKDKSAVQLRDDEFAAERARYDAQKVLTDKATARADTLYAANREVFVQRAVGALIAASGIPAARDETAVREAMAENNFSALDPDNNGNFTLQMTVGGLAADDNAKAFDAWYKPRTDLHAQTGTTLPPPGAGVPPGPAPPKNPMEGLTPAQQFAVSLQQTGSTEG